LVSGSWVTCSSILKLEQNFRVEQFFTMEELDGGLIISGTTSFLGIEKCLPRSGAVGVGDHRSTRNPGLGRW
jgi:hypothetical protein